MEQTPTVFGETVGADRTGRGKARRYELLDGLRGIAALVVVLGHLGWQVDLQWALFPHFYLAVDFFFLLSGFVIADAYDTRLRTPRMSFQRFVVVRWIRLYPMVVLGLCVGLAMGLFQYYFFQAPPPANILVLEFLLALFMLPVVYPIGGLAPNLIFPLNSPLWSLFWEMVANIVYAAVSKTMTTRSWCAVVSVAALALCGYALTHNGVDRGGRELAGGLVRVSYSFFGGILLWRLRPHMPDLRFPLLPLVGIFTLILAMPLPPHVNALYDIAAVIVAFPLIVYGASNIELQRRAAAMASWAGAVSYPLYTLHYPFMSLIEALHRLEGWTRLQSLVIVLLLTGLFLVMVHLVLRFIDEPLRVQLRAWADVRSTPRAETAP